MKRIKDILDIARLLAVMFFCIGLFVLLFWAFSPYLAACFDFTEDWTLEEKMQLWEAIRNPY